MKNKLIAALVLILVVVAGYSYSPKADAANTVTVTASQNPITAGGSTIISWSASAGATSCTSSQFTVTGGATSGSVTLSPAATTTYTVTCTWPDPPATPTGLTATASSCGTGTINISWSASSGATSYTLKDGATAIYTGSGTSFAHTGLTAGSSHSYTVLATNSAGSSAASAAKVATAPATCPVPVVTLTANPTSGTAGVVNPTLTWSATNSPTSCTASGDWSGTKAASGSAAQGVLSTVKTYTYTLTCANSGGTSAPQSATVVVSAAIPPTPTGLSATPGACSSGAISLSWSSSSGATSYSLKDGATVIYTGSSTSYSHTGLTAGSSHSYTVAATNSSGTSSYSSAVGATAPVLCTYTVTASAGSGGTISPSSRSVTSGSTTTFTVTPNSGYTASVGGTCGGSLSGTTYTTNAITANCTVVASFSQMSGTLTPASSSCTIASGASSCTSSTLTWNVTNPVSTTAVTNNGSATPSSPGGNSGSQAFTVPYNSAQSGVTTFYLYNNSLLLAQATVTTSCASGSGWNGSTCAANTVPTVTSPTASSITTSGATLGANVTSLGSPASISARGTCWGISPAPTTNCTAQGGTTTGAFTQARTGMSSSTTYYYRGYATNATGTGYSSDGTFTTGSAGVTPNAPTIVGPSSFPVSTTETFYFTGTDPASNQIQYQVDWGDGSAVTWLPSSSTYVNSGTTLSATHSWSSANNYTIKALTKNNPAGGSQSSAQTLYAVSANYTASLTVSPTTASPGQSISISWTSNAPSCNGNGGNFNTGGANTGGPISVIFNPVPPATSVTYSINCGGATDQKPVNEQSASPPVFQEP